VTTQTRQRGDHGDNKVEGNETFSLNLSQPVGSQIFAGTGIGTILNDDGKQAVIRLQLSKAQADPTDPNNWLTAGTVLNVNDNFVLDVFVQDIQAAPARDLSRLPERVCYDSTLVSAKRSDHICIHFSVAQSGSTSHPGLDRRGGSHQRQYRAAGRPERGRTAVQLADEGPRRRVGKLS